MAKNNIISEARKALDLLKADVIKAQGYKVNRADSDNVKYEIADELGILSTQGYNGKPRIFTDSLTIH
ncbi:small, acid-soluble spore protein, alpha/beta type [Sporosarcina sp. FSL K6-3457]|uniref:small, acid-soluble spore protein, alpha/beta type n=1 Tax=Sporosarcina sp. FSL K6-3457 TaxID=2978204 RepID=UPI0030F55702